MKRVLLKTKGFCTFFIFFVFLLNGLSGWMWSQEKAPKKEYPPPKHYVVKAATSSIKIDGVLDEPSWKEAVKLKVLYEWMPGDAIPALVDTDVLVTFDKNRLYIGFRCFDPDPKKIRAHLMDRDAIDTFIMDDHISMMIDTFNDERRAFQFRVNPLGVQADANFSELEGYEDFPGMPYGNQLVR